MDKYNMQKKKKSIEKIFSDFLLFCFIENIYSLSESG